MRRTIGVIGELCLTVGVLLVLFIVWQIGFVGVVDGRRQAEVVQGLEKSFAAAPASPSAPIGAPTSASGRAPPPTASAGTAFAVLRIPRLGGPDWAKPVYEGVGVDVLARGLGRYPASQAPGQVGNLAIAGHRSGHGNPLIDIDAIQPGDAMVVETADGYYVYRAVRHEIVEADRSDVIAPVPERPGAKPTERWLTLTTCNPRYGSSQRYIVFARFAERVPRDTGLPASALADPGDA